MPRLINWLVLLFLYALLGSTAHAEYCLNWQSWLQQRSGQSSRCWSTESECQSYYSSRCLSSTYRHDCAGMCYYRPGFYPKTGEKKSGEKNNVSGQAVKAEEANKQKQQIQQQQLQQQYAAEKARQQATFDKEKQGLIGEIKGVSASEPSNKITMKPVPPAGEQARSQLDCIAHNKSGESWETHAADCTPVVPRVPEPGTPIEAVAEPPADPALLAKFLDALKQRMSSARESLEKQDREITAIEQEITLKEQKVSAPNTSADDSSAIKRAREALAKAKADRERTAMELSRLEKQETAAQNKAQPPAK